MDNLDMEKSSYGGLERFIYIFLLPVLFTVVLTGVLLTLFDFQVKDTIYNIGRKIPIINYIVPDEETTEDTGINPTNATIQNDDQIEILQTSLSTKETEIDQLQSELQSKEESLKTLEESVQKLILEQETVAVNSEEYRKQLKSLANMYSNMTASKAAPILENLTLPELVLVLYEMDSDDRGRILEKMNPKTAADASIQLKDINDSNRTQFEDKANKAREERTKADDPLASNKLTNTELAQTFAAMTPESAATILIELNKSNSVKVVTILNAMDNSSRSQMLKAIADHSPTDAALLANKLTQ